MSRVSFLEVFFSNPFISKPKRNGPTSFRHILIFHGHFQVNDIRARTLELFQEISRGMVVESGGSHENISIKRGEGDHNKKIFLI